MKNPAISTESGDLFFITSWTKEAFAGQKNSLYVEAVTWPPWVWQKKMIIPSFGGFSFEKLLRTEWPFWNGDKSRTTVGTLGGGPPNGCTLLRSTTDKTT